MTRRLPAGLLPALALAACLCLPSRADSSPAPGKTVVVTYSVLGAVVADLVGDRLAVKVLIPNGMDLHEWEPSARDVEALGRADLIVANGLELEAGLLRAIERARRAGARVFTASEHVALRRAAQGEGEQGEDEHGGHGHRHGAADPHLWTDPMAMKAVARGLAQELRTGLGVEVGDRLVDLERRLDALDAEIRAAVEAIPPGAGSWSPGTSRSAISPSATASSWSGAVVPSLTTAAESSAAHIAALKLVIAASR